MKILTFENNELGEIEIQSRLERPIVLVPAETDGVYEEAEHNSLLEVLAKLNFRLVSSPYDWPRDEYVYNRGIFFSYFDFGSLGSGGNIVFGERFVLVSTRVLYDANFSVKQFLEDHSGRMFPGLDVVMVEPLKKPYGDPIYPASIDYHFSGHIDLTIGSVPSRNLLTVDSGYYEQQREIFEQLSLAYGTTVVPIIAQGEKERNQWGNNYFVVEEGLAEPLIVANNGSNRVVAELRNMGLQVFCPRVKIKHSPRTYDGGIRCMTNVVYSDAILEYLEQTSWHSSITDQGA